MQWHHTWPFHHAYESWISGPKIVKKFWQTQHLPNFSLSRICITIENNFLLPLSVTKFSLFLSLSLIFISPSNPCIRQAITLMRLTWSVAMLVLHNYRQATPSTDNSYKWDYRDEWNQKVIQKFNSPFLDDQLMLQLCYKNVSPFFLFFLSLTVWTL